MRAVAGVSTLSLCGWGDLKIDGPWGQRPPAHASLPGPEDSCVRPPPVRVVPAGPLPAGAVQRGVPVPWEGAAAGAVRPRSLRDPQSRTPGGQRRCGLRVTPPRRPAAAPPPAGSLPPAARPRLIPGSPAAWRRRYGEVRGDGVPGVPPGLGPQVLAGLGVQRPPAPSFRQSDCEGAARRPGGPPGRPCGTGGVRGPDPDTPPTLVLRPLTLGAQTSISPSVSWAALREPGVPTCRDPVSVLGRGACASIAPTFSPALAPSSECV